MKIILVIMFFIFLYWLICKIDNAKDYKKWKQAAIITKYRIHITCNDVIIARTFSGNNFSDVLNKAIDYSYEEENDFPDVIVLTKDIICPYK